MTLDKFGCFLNEKEYSKEIEKGVEKFQSLFNDSDGNLNLQRKRFTNCLPPIHENDIATKNYVDDEIDKVFKNIPREIAMQPQKQAIFKVKPRINNIESKLNEFTLKIENYKTNLQKFMTEINKTEDIIFNYLILPKSKLKSETISKEQKPFIPNKVKI